MKTKIYFRTDGNSQIGLGHLFRSLALADMLRKDFECIFLVRNPLENLIPKIESIAKLIKLPTPKTNLEEAQHIAQEYISDRDIIVLDGYDFRTVYQKALKKTGCKLVCIDDIHAYYFVADVIINHASGIDKKDYSYPFGTKLYLGLRYLLLQKVFLDAAKNKKNRPANENIFISLGGADTHNHTLTALQIIEKKKPTAKCYVVLGQAYKHKLSFFNFVKKSNLDIRYFEGLSAQEMHNCMSACSQAVCPPSTICFEYLTTRGTLYLYQTADNQKDNKRFLLNQQLAFGFDDFPVQSTSLLEKSIALQKHLIDGNSSQRLKKVFTSLSISIDLVLREATYNDIKLYFDWANDPLVRKNAINQNPIDWENHQSWFERKVTDKNTALFILEYKNTPIGQIRFDINLKKIAYIDYSISTTFRGKGIGAYIISMGIQKCSKKTKDIQAYQALVKPSNIASCIVFEKNDFQKKESIIEDNTLLYSFELKNDFSERL